MTCVHLKKLYQFCQDEHVRIGSADLVRVVCEQCGVQEECPSMLIEEFETREAMASGSNKAASAGQSPARE
jgi:hypothetical protein